ncbi:hypothetical protein Tco_0003878 [Tanacetum coccineum]
MPHHPLINATAAAPQRVRLAVVTPKGELYEEEQWGSFCSGSCFEIYERVRHRDVVIGNIVARENHQIAHRVVSYLREIQDHDMDML